MMLTLPYPACFISWLLLCSTLQMEVIIENVWGSSGVSWLPAPRLLGELLYCSVEGRLQLPGGPSEGLPGDWADVNLNKQCGQNERGRRKVVALKRAFGLGTHILLKFTQFPKTSGTGETRHIRCPLGNNGRQPSSNQCKQRKEEIYVFMSSELASGIACSRVQYLSARMGFILR